jgi:hypothetical protein
MVKLDKSPLPEGVHIENENDYRSEPVFSILKKDCHNKCYICEEKEPTGLNVEHRVPHGGNSRLKYDWNNLFLSCIHCNHAKGSRYANVLDCTQVDPEDYIGLSLAIELKEKVVIEKFLDGNGVEETIALLNRVYNGEATAMLCAECENLRNEVLRELSLFQQDLVGYKEEPDPGLKRAFRSIITDKISRASGFAAFKRKIVRDDPGLAAEFRKDLS